MVGVLYVLWLLLCAVAIYFSCEWFVNAVEWLGSRMRLGQLAVGTVLAAFGTALPESVVTLLAVTTGRTESAKDIGVGAALGGPLVLATLAYAVTGLVLWLRRRAVAPATALRHIDARRLSRDQLAFLAVFAVKVALGLVAFALKPWLGLLFFATYLVYFFRELRSGAGGEAPDDLEPLKLQRGRAVPDTWAIVVQTVITVGVIFVAARVFVDQLDVIGPMLGLPAGVTALLLSPIATELPEILNAIIWVRQGKTALALANISGAMMIQATIPSGLGLLFTTWRFDAPLTWGAGLTAAAIVYLLITLRAGKLSAVRLAWAGASYLVFAAGLPILL